MHNEWNYSGSKEGVEFCTVVVLYCKDIYDEKGNGLAPERAEMLLIKKNFLLIHVIITTKVNYLLIKFL